MSARIASRPATSRSASGRSCAQNALWAATGLLARQKAELRFFGVDEMLVVELRERRIIANVGGCLRPETQRHHFVTRGIVVAIAAFARAGAAHVVDTRAQPGRFAWLPHAPKLLIFACLFFLRIFLLAALRARRGARQRDHVHHEV